MPRFDQVTGVILAGGRARRMGGEDKGLVEIAGRPMVAWILERLAPQVDAVLINANRNQDRYAALGVPVVGDTMPDFAGPLAGMAAALAQAATPWIATVPCDGPFLPADLVSRLQAACERERAEIAVAHDGERMQPVYALIPAALRGSLEGFLQAGERKIDLWYARHRLALADFSDRRDTFVNINTPQERDAVELRLRPGEPLRSRA